jgi:hypothetical protein
MILERKTELRREGYRVRGLAAGWTTELIGTSISTKNFLKKPL